MKNRRHLLTIMIIGLVYLLCGCASEEDKEIALQYSDKIDNITAVSEENAAEILDLESDYKSLTEKQQKLVRNHEKLEEFVEAAEEIKAKSDPTYYIKKEDMNGIWKKTSMDNGYYGYLYFDGDTIYYLASKEGASEASFSGQYIVAYSYDLGEYRYEEKTKYGSFDCSANSEYYSFDVSVTSNGNMTLVLDGATMGGTYKKSGTTSGSVNEENSTGQTEYEHTCEVDGCNNEGIHPIYGLNGYYEYYCNEHYKEMIDAYNMIMDNDNE